MKFFSLPVILISSSLFAASGELNCSPLIGTPDNGVEGSVSFSRDTLGNMKAKVFDNYLSADLICSKSPSTGIQCKGLWHTMDGSKETAAVRLNSLGTGFSVDLKRPDEYGSEIITYQCK